MKRIFIFSEFYFPDQISSGYYVTEIAEHLAQQFNVIVVCVSNVKKLTQETRNNVSIIRLPDSGLDKNNLIKRSLRFIRISRNFFRIGKRNINPDDHVVCVTNPAFSIIAFSKLKKKINFILTIFVHDVFPENIVGSGILSSRNVIYKLLLIFFNKAYAKADHIVTCGRDMKALFEKKLTSFKGKITYIPNWGDHQSITPDFLKGLEIRKKLGLDGKLIFQFAGNLGRAQGIPLILDAAKRVSDPNVSFLFFGNGVLAERVKTYATGSNNVIYGGVFPREESNVYLNVADIALVSLTNGMKGLGVPSKTFNIMAAGKPILYIGEKDSEIALMIEEEKIGYIVTPGSVNDLINAINYFICLNGEELRKMGERSRQALLDKYTKDIILDKYSKLF